jgi:hypothetical protein
MKNPTANVMDLPARRPAKAAPEGSARVGNMLGPIAVASVCI